MTRIRMSLLVISFFFVVGLLIVFTNQNMKYQELLLDYDDLSLEHQKLKQDYESLSKDSNLDTETISGSVKRNSFIQRYHGMKYPVESGMRRYIGKEPLRIYPSSMAPFVYEDWNPEVVELINEVSTLNEEGNNEETWCLVLDSARGISGYVNRSDLITIDEKDNNYTHDYGNGIETLGGFKVGDRIETLIGLLDRDYYLIYENGRIYEFPDNRSKDIVVEPMKRPFSEIESLDAFVGYTNLISRLRTDSPEFTLKEGYKVGDNAMKVLDYYASKYKPLNDQESEYEYPGYTFILEEGHMLEFFINTEELNENSVITSIWID